MKNAYILGQLLIGLFLSINSFAQTTLVAGDIAILSYNADEVGNEDEFTFVLLRDIAAGTVIRFTDFGWASDINGFQSANPCGASTGSVSDGAITWTAPAGGLLCGTQVHVVCGGLTLSTSAGTVVGLQQAFNFPSEFISLSPGGDQICAFQGTLATPTLITAINMNGAWDAALLNCSFTATQSVLPAALNATTSVAIIPEIDNSRYNCTVTNDSPTNLRAAIFNNANWTGDDATPFILPLTCSFGCSACAPPTLNLSSQTNVSCNGGTNGSATITASGGAPFTYAWSPSGGTAATATGLSAGVYTCVVTNSCGATASQSVTITQPTAIVLNANSQTNVSCNGGTNGAASVVPASGGAGGYTYNWTPGNPTGDGTVSVTGLTAQTYTCTVTDANACTATRNFTITQPTAISLTAASQTNVSCFGGSNGAASVNAATGGAGGYTYNWTPGNPTGDGTVSVTGLVATTYTCTVTDANSCTATRNFTITSPTAITVTPASQTNVSCFGGSNGAASINTPTGGAGGYTYNWTPGNPTGDGTVSVTGLTPGTWTCTVTDANSCTATQNFTITSPTAITVTPASQTNVSCFGGSNGAASINTPIGGAGGYTYNWTPGNPTGDGTVSVTGLTATTWTCTVTDANGCTRTQNFTVTAPTAITASISSTASSCSSSTGTATVSAVSGGAGGYTYDWTPGTPTGDGTTSISGLSAGTWTCTITDANGCVLSQNSTVTSAAAPSLTAAAQTNVSCFGGSNGAASVNAATGGAGGYTYNWTPGNPTGD
ncbi:MAG: SprB repeat-containing protein, partial [Fluviicola sp.]|nr:SprB repeat-containing protein [Fluviicola sp.]